MDRVFDNPKYPPKLFVTLCQVKVIQDYEVKKVKIKISDLGDMIHVFMSDFR